MREKTMGRPEAAAGLFRDGHACSQAILATYGPDYGLDREPAVRIAAGFASGMRLADVCGAATGAVMVLGLAFCGGECVVREGRAIIASRVSVFLARFRERTGSLMCRDLLGCDVTTPEGMSFAREHDLFRTVCAQAVRSATEALEEMLPPR